MEKSKLVKLHATACKTCKLDKVGNQNYLNQMYLSKSGCSMSNKLPIFQKNFKFFKSYENKHEHLFLNHVEDF